MCVCEQKKKQKQDKNYKQINKKKRKTNKKKRIEYIFRVDRNQKKKKLHLKMITNER